MAVGRLTQPPLRSQGNHEAQGRPVGRRIDLAYVRRAQSGSPPGAMSDAVERFIPLARSLARRFIRTQEPLEDLEQVASLGLLKAIDGFDADLGTAFGSYAVPTILGELRRHLRDRGWMVRVPRDLQDARRGVAMAQEELGAALGRPATVGEVADRMRVSPERVQEAREATFAMHPISLDLPASPSGGNGDTEAPVDRCAVSEDSIAEVEDQVTVRELLRQLPARDRRVLLLRYHADLTQSEVAERVGVSQMHVSRILRRSVGSMSALAGGRPAPT